MSAAALLALVGALLAPVAAHAAVGLSGVVVGPTGSVLSSVSIKAVDADTGAEVASATSTSSGAFSFSLAPDVYTLKFAQTGSTFAQYLGGTSVLANAQRITLDGGSGDKSTIKASLSAAGVISGSVKTTANTAVAGATVSVFVAKDAKWALVRTASTSSSGAYAITGLEPGEYRLQVKKGTTYAPLYSGGAASIHAASDIGVLPSKTSTVNFKVGSPAKVSGTVRVDNGSTIVPLAGVKVTAWRFVGTASPTAQVEKLPVSATTTATGGYTLTGLPPGDYTLYFEAPVSSDAGSTFLGTSAQPNQALSFVVGSGASVTGRNITLDEAGTISGVYQRSGGSPAINVRVSLYGDGEDPDAPLAVPRAVVFTGLDGSFTFGHLGAGDYDVVFGAFERSLPTENIDFQRRGWSTINLAAGEDETGVSPTTVSRDPYAPLSGQEPQTILSAFYPGKVGGWAELTIGTWNNSGYNVVGGYRWYRDGVLIPHEDGYQYAFRPGDVGHKISGELYRTDWAIGYGSYRAGETPAVLPGDAPTNVNGAPAVIGPAKVGGTLSVDPSDWEVVESSGDSFGRDLGIVWTYTWQRSVNMSVYSDLETAPTHTVTAADLTSGPYVRVHMHGEREGFADVEYDTLPVFIQQGEFTQVKAPKVTATTTTFKADPGSWTPTPASVQYAWRVYDATNTLVDTKTTQTISRSGLTGKKVTLTLTYDADQVEQEVVEILVQRGKAPVAVGTGAVGGTVRVGNSITAPTFNWGLGPDSFTYRWQFLSGTTWKNIAGATGFIYDPTAAFVGKRLRVIVTAITAGYTNGSRTSLTTVPVALGLPVGPNMPADFSAAPAANVVAIVDPKTTVPTATSVTYLWQSGPTATGPWTTISGATTATYKVPASLLNKWIQVTVRHKLAGRADLVQVLNAQVMAGLPVNTVKPTVTGPANGAMGIYTLTSNGTWAPAPTSFDHVWKMINPDGSGDVDYGTSATFDSSMSAGFQPLDVVVTTTGPAGWGGASIRIPVKDGIFQYNAPASIAESTAPVGGVLHGSLPMLFNGPVGAQLAPRWEYEKTPGVWTAIPGATSVDYAPTVTYLGKNVRFTVRATNARYYASDSSSDPLLVVTGLQPTPGSGADAPAFSDTPRLGQKLVFTPGTWSVAGLTFAYRWQSRPTSGDPWTDIPGATTASFVPDEARWGHELQMKVTATKSGYATAVFELGAGTIGDGELNPVVNPTVTKSGTILTVHPGTWNATGLSIVYQWAREYPDGAVDILTTGPTYALTPADSGLKVYAAVYVGKTHYLNGSASALAQSGARIEPTSTITITGDRVVGQTLTAGNPTWNVVGVVPVRQWLRNGVAIPGQTNQTYQPTTADLGKTISVRTTAARFGYPGYTSTVSAGVIVAAAAPVSVTAPVVSVVGGGDPRVGKTLSVSPGTWSLTGLTFGYQWYRGVNKIVGATASTYALTAADLGYELSAKVTATKAGVQPASALTQMMTVKQGAAPTAAVPTVTIVGGNTLKSSAVTWSPAATTTYQWQISADGNTWSDVTGATADTAPTSIVIGGWQVRVQVTGHRPGYADGVVSSAGMTLP